MYIENNIYDYLKKENSNTPEIKNINIYECRNVEEEVIKIAHEKIKLLKENKTYKTGRFNRNVLFLYAVCFVVSSCRRVRWQPF